MDRPGPGGVDSGGLQAVDNLAAEAGEAGRVGAEFRVGKSIAEPVSFRRGPVCAEGDGEVEEGEQVAVGAETELPGLIEGLADDGVVNVTVKLLGVGGKVREIGEEGGP